MGLKWRGEGKNEGGRMKDRAKLQSLEFWEGLFSNRWKPAALVYPVIRIKC